MNSHSQRDLFLHILIFSFLIIAVWSPVIFAQSLNDTTAAYIAQYPQPQKVEDFHSVVHFSPVNQDTTFICWSFATTSFIESEMSRLGLASVRLSVIYPVYYAFIEKARRFIATHGASRFNAGDLFTGVFTTVQKYGEVPASVYSGQTRSCTTRNHEVLYSELDSLMKRVKTESLWDEATVLPLVRGILDHHLGAPPEEFTYNGIRYTPRSFCADVVKIPWDEYIKVQSFMYTPFFHYSRLRVPDNWALDSTYYNIPLDLFCQSIRQALTSGYSVAFDADISEPEYEYGKGVVMIPEWDIPKDKITPEARQFRFDNNSTMDDHLMHIIGYTRQGNDDWFLVKDSWRTAYQGNHPGYMFVHGSYLELKALSFMVHRDAIPDIGKSIEK
jgi:bleomycin hydrolase